MMLNEKQRKAANNLRLALNRAGKAGLIGGVFSGNFCIWRACDYLGGDDFFETIEDIGEILHTPHIELDGGAGN